MSLRLALLAVTVSLAAGAAPVAPFQDNNCSVPNGPNPWDYIYSPSAFGCKDKLSFAECQQLFNPAYGGQDFQKKAGDPTGLRPLECYMSTSTGNAIFSGEKKNLALANCPNYCGYCCQVAQTPSAAPGPAPSAQKCNPLGPAIDYKCPPGFSVLFNQYYDKGGFCIGSTDSTECYGCADRSADCAVMKTTGFCNSTFYTNAQKLSQCAKTCGLCSQYV